MAKRNKANAKTLPAQVQVKSKRYGDHVRSARGTFKPAVLNETMEQSKNSLLKVNTTARLIFNALREEHKDGSLWSRLLSALRLQLKEQGRNDIACLKELECHSVYTLQKMLRSCWPVQITGIINRNLQIEIKIDRAPSWRVKSMRHFQVSVQVLYADLVKHTLQKEVVDSELYDFARLPGNVSFSIPIPAGARDFALFLKVTGCDKEGGNAGISTTGMGCVKLGKVVTKRQQAAGSRK